MVFLLLLLLAITKEKDVNLVNNLVPDCIHMRVDFDIYFFSHFYGGGLPNQMFRIQALWIVTQMRGVVTVVFVALRPEWN